MKLLTERQMQKDFLLKEGDYRSTKEVFERIARYIPNKTILVDLDKNRKMVNHSAKEILSDIENLGNGLLALGFENKHIVVSSHNSYRYLIVDATVSGGVGIITPIDCDATPEHLKILLSKCDAEVVICSAKLVEKFESVKKECPKLQTIITIDNKKDNYLWFDEIIEKGKEDKSNTYHHKVLDLTAPAKILFTSGTTGANKAVILSQNNLAANIINCMDTIKARKGCQNTSMSILPMHHATEINTHIMARIACGRLTYINDDIKNLMINIKIFKPEIITIVPMIANMFYRTIWANAKKLGKTDKMKKGIALCKFLKCFGIDITHKLFKEVFAPFGGNLCQIVCGGAMLNAEVVKGFLDLGVYIINGYGITECGPLISMNADTMKEPFSIGKPCPNLSAKLVDVDENFVGELCVKGKSVSSGYYNDPEATKLVFDNNGYFHTGDLAKVNKYGELFLVGRKKNVIILSNGKNICPEEIESAIENSMSYCQDIVVYTITKNVNGIEQEIICAGIYIEDANLRKDKEKIKKDFINLNSNLELYKQIKFVNIVDEPYEKTSTKKIKRDCVISKHSNDEGIAI